VRDLRRGDGAFTKHEDEISDADLMADPAVADHVLACELAHRVGTLTRPRQRSHTNTSTVPASPMLAVAQLPLSQSASV